MPRESRKMSSRNKRRIDRNVALNSIREMLHHSSSSNRYSPFSRDVPRRSPSASKNDIHRAKESSVFTLTPRESPELRPPHASLPSTPPTTVSPSRNEEASAKKSQNIKPPIPRDASAVPTKLSTENASQLNYKKLVEHGIHYIMLPIHLLQFCVWGNKTGAILPTLELKKLVPNVVEPSESVSKPKGEVSARLSECEAPITAATPIAHKIVPQVQDALDLSSDEELSDEMVTANESYDDSSNDQWSSASSASGLINMSVDFANNNIEKYNNQNVIEEPMEVTVDDSNSIRQLKSPPRARGAGKSISEHQREFSSSESSSGYTWSDGVSSVDREIAGIFARACTSSSSSDEDISEIEYLHSGFRHRKPGTPLVRRRRICEQSPKTPSKSRSRPLRKKNSPLVKLPGQKIIQEKLASPTDSAYSDEENKMSFHESYLPLPSVPTIESMDQDFEYGGDTEDSNDGITAMRPRVLTYETNLLQVPNEIDPIGASHVRSESSTSRDQGFEEREDALRNIMQRERLQKWADTFSLDKSMLHLQITRNSSQLSGYSEFTQGIECSCGSSACYPVPIGVTLPQAPTGPTILSDIYPPAPTPLPHLYYQYPEFMNRTIEQLNNYPKYNVSYEYMNSYH